MYDYSKGNIDTLGDGGCLTYVLTLGKNIASSKSRRTKMIKQFTITIHHIGNLYNFHYCLLYDKIVHFLFPPICGNPTQVFFRCPVLSQSILTKKPSWKCMSCYCSLLCIFRFPDAAIPAKCLSAVQSYSTENQSVHLPIVISALLGELFQRIVFPCVS